MDTSASPPVQQSSSGAPTSVTMNTGTSSASAPSGSSGAAATSAPTLVSNTQDMSPTSVISNTQDMNPANVVSNIDMSASGDAIAPLLTALEQAPDSFENSLNAGMNASAKLAMSTSTPDSSTPGASITNQNLQMKSTPPPASPATGSTSSVESPRSALSQPIAQQMNAVASEDVLVDLQSNSEKTTQVLEDLKNSISKRQTNIVNNTNTQNVSTTDFIINTDTLRKRTRNTSLTS